jgi:ABC-2 type transport system permease protein
LLASYGAFGVIGPGLFAFGIGLALERDQGYLKWRLVLHSPMRNYFLAKMLVALGFALLIISQLLLCANLLAGYKPTLWQIIALYSVLGLGSLPFAAIGLAFGACLRSNAAPGILNGVYLPAAALSGLWFPLFLLPPLVQQLAVLLPPYHLGQLAQSALGRSDGQEWLHIGALLLTTVIALLIARRGLRRMPF